MSFVTFRVVRAGNPGDWKVPGGLFISGCGEWLMVPSQEGCDRRARTRGLPHGEEGEEDGGLELCS